MPHSDTDWVLEAFLEGVSTEKVRLDLTVFCGGLVVSGAAVSEDVYFQTIGLSSFAGTLSKLRENDREVPSEVASKLGRESLTVRERQTLTPAADELRNKFIVMVDVTILGAGPTPIKAPAWRGRLSQISGWVLGALDESE
jgi:hypothetical protein